MSEENKAVMRRWFDEVWNQRRRDSIGELFALDGVAYGLEGDDKGTRGPEAFATFQAAFLDAFPNLTVSVEDVIAEGDLVALRWRVSGTLTGKGLGIMPTGRSMSVSGMSFTRIRDGKIIEAWNNFDVLGMHQQAGTISQLAKE